MLTPAKGKEYCVWDRITKELHWVIALSAQEACEKVGRMIGDCQVKEVSPPINRRQWKMEIQEALKRDDVSIRIVCDDKWLVWSLGEWCVFTRPYRAKFNRVLYRGDSFETAVQFLVLEEY